MKNSIFFVILFVLMSLAGFKPAFAESIYKKDGTVVQAKITEVSNGTIWCETTTGDVVEYLGVDSVDVEKVLNDDGTVSQFSPTYSAPKQ